MTKKFVNAIVPVFHADHITAVINEALRIGYRLDKTCPSLVGSALFGTIQSIHLEPSGKIYGYCSCTAEYLINEGQPREFYRDAVLLIKLRKLRGLYAELNKTEVVTCSRDNQSALVVRPKCIVVASVSGRVQMVQPNRSVVPSRSYCTPYGVYGSSEFTVLSEATQEDKSKVVWVRPKAENPVVSKVVVWSVLTISKIVSVVKRVIKSIKGDK